jgi:hypothetical protein
MQVNGRRPDPDVRHALPRGPIETECLDGRRTFAPIPDGELGEAPQLLVYLILASKRWIPADRLSTGHTHTLTVFADFADSHMVSSQFSPTRGDDFEISSLPSFYSPIGRGRIDLRHRTLLLPSLL